MSLSKRSFMPPIALTISSCDSSTARVRTRPLGWAAEAAAGGCSVLAPATLEQWGPSKPLTFEKPEMLGSSGSMTLGMEGESREVVAHGDASMYSVQIND